MPELFFVAVSSRKDNNYMRFSFRLLFVTFRFRCYRGLLDIVASASEFNELPVRQQEEKALKMLAQHLPQKVRGQ